MLDHSPEEAHRRDGDLLRMAVVRSVTGRKCVVAAGELESGPVPWFVGRAGKTRRWSKVSPGEQGLLLCPEGDIAAGVFLPGCLSDAFDAPTTDDVEVVAFQDGAEFRYDPAAHVLSFTLPDGGRFTIKADVAIDGAVTVTKGVVAQDDVIGRGVSLHDHHHTLVKAGPDLSGPPGRRLMRGLSSTTGAAIEGAAHLRQSIADILSTPLGSRVMRRDYGSLLPRLIDQPAGPGLVLRIIAATADAIRRWEPRLKLTRVAVEQLAPGSWRLTLEGVRTDLPAPVAYGRLTLPLIAGRAAVVA